MNVSVMHLLIVWLYTYIKLPPLQMLASLLARNDDDEL